MTENLKALIALFSMAVHNHDLEQPFEQLALGVQKLQEDLEDVQADLKATRQQVQEARRCCDEEFAKSMKREDALMKEIVARNKQIAELQSQVRDLTLACAKAQGVEITLTPKEAGFIVYQPSFTTRTGKKVYDPAHFEGKIKAIASLKTRTSLSVVEAKAVVDKYCEDLLKNL